MYKWLSFGLAIVAALVLPGNVDTADAETRLAAAGQEAVPEALVPAQSGSTSKEIAALEVAAELGVLKAQMKLARLYAAGEGVPRSHEKAFRLYQRIVDDHAEMRPHNAKAGSVARAFVALANYYRTGVPGSGPKINKHHAIELLWYAASYLGAAEAQYALAQMYLDGEGAPRNSRLAINWLANAAKKRHAKAQALLGDLLWHGAKDVSRQPVKGLAFLSLARQNARDAGEARWVDGLFTTAYSASQTHERESAERLVARWQKRLGREDIHASAPDKPDTKIEPKSQKGADRSFRPDHTAGVTSVGMKRTGTVR